MGCLSIFAYPFLALKWCVTNGLKGFIILAVVIVIGIVGFNCVQSQMPWNREEKAVEQAIVQQIPTLAEAPYLVTTQSRYYYAVKAVTKNKVTTMTGYYELIGGKWVKRSGILELGQEYGEVRISKRRE